MRDDFHKVVIERPRGGSRLPSRKTGWASWSYTPDLDDDLPKSESSSWEWNSPRKCFSDRLGPLERFLGTQVGRPWRKVEGELRNALDGRTVIGRHLLDHAERMVEHPCRLTPEGRPIRLDGYPIFRTYFVHPRTGLLLRKPNERRDVALERRRKIDETEKLTLDDRTRAERINGLWFLFLDEGRTEEIVEVRRVGALEVAIRAVRPILRKKQANTEEIRQIRSALERETR
jgi:hypothetical protein